MQDAVTFNDAPLACKPGHEAAGTLHHTLLRCSRALQGTLVAIKLLLSVDERGQERFRAEVETLAALRHPKCARCVVAPRSAAFAACMIFLASCTAATALA